LLPSIGHSRSPRRISTVQSVLTKAIDAKGFQRLALARRDQVDPSLA
jgi:hypothetical protein